MSNLILLPAKRRVEVEYGDVLYGAEWIDRFVKSHDLIGRRAFFLSLLSSNRWIALAKLTDPDNHGAKRIYHEHVKYGCPWTQNSYDWWHPFAILVNGKDIYSEHNQAAKIGGWDLTEKIGEDKYDHPFKATGIISAMMGHGYTSSTLPSDGHGSQQVAIVEMSNGDELLVHCWVWHNK